MKKINVKLTIEEIQAIAIATANEWIKYEERFNHPLHTRTDFDNKILKNWKNLSEYLFKIYRINK